jgi:hypothetical protein
MSLTSITDPLGSAPTCVTSSDDSMDDIYRCLENAFTTSNHVICTQIFLANETARNYLLRHVREAYTANQFIQLLEDLQKLTVSNFAVNIENIVSKRNKDDEFAAMSILLDDVNYFKELEYNDVTNDKLSHLNKVMENEICLMLSTTIFPTFIRSSYYFQWLEHEKNCVENVVSLMGNKNNSHAISDILAVHTTNTLTPNSSSHKCNNSEFFLQALANVDPNELPYLLTPGSWLPLLIGAAEALPIAFTVSAITHTSGNSYYQRLNSSNSDSSQHEDRIPYIYTNKAYNTLTGYKRDFNKPNSTKTGKRDFLRQKLLSSFYSVSSQYNIVDVNTGQKIKDIKRQIKAMKNLRRGKTAHLEFACSKQNGVSFQQLVVLKPIFDERMTYRYVIGLHFNNSLYQVKSVQMAQAYQILSHVPDLISTSLPTAKNAATSVSA